MFVSIAVKKTLSNNERCGFSIFKKCGSKPTYVINLQTSKSGSKAAEYSELEFIKAFHAKKIFFLI